MDEVFFFMYHLKIPPSETLRMPVFERRWMIDLYIQQKEREHQAAERARNK